MDTNINVIDILSKVALLNKKLSKAYFRGLMEPFDFVGDHLIQVHEATDKIAAFLGLERCHFLIRYTNEFTNENTAGYITHGAGMNAVIRLDYEYAKDTRICASIICHEVMHKFLYEHDIVLPNELDNERLTDIATIFLGLGKLRLLGMTYQQIYFEDTDLRTANVQFGYLTPDEFYFVYSLTNSLLGYKKSVTESALPPEVVYNIRRIESRNCIPNVILKNQFGAWKKHGYYRKEIFLELAKCQKYYSHFLSITIPEQLEISNLLRNETLSIHESLNRIRVLEKNITYAERENKNLRSCRLLHKEIYHREDKYIKRATAKISRAYRKFLKNHPDSMLLEPSDTIDELINNLKEFRCPLCNKKMRISKNTIAFVKCSGCQYRFAVDAQLKLMEGFDHLFESESIFDSLRRRFNFLKRR